MKCDLCGSEVRVVGNTTKHYEPIETSTIAENEIIQLNPYKTKNKVFSGCLAIVTEPKDWGVICYVQITGESGQPGGAAYYRAETGTFEKTGGVAPWIVR